MRAQLLVVALATGTVAGCQTYEGDPNSPYYIVPTGSQVVLNQELQFRPEQISLYVQDGKILSMSEVRHYDPFCKFELYSRQEAARTIAPDQMTVTRATQQRQDGPFSQAERVQVAQVSIGVFARMGGDEDAGGSTLWSFVTRMDLRSDKQPDVYRLTCLRAAYPGMEEHVSIAEIRRTLGPVFTLRLPGES